MLRLRVMLLSLALSLAVLWQGCDSGGGGGFSGDRGFINGNGNTATYLLYTDEATNTVTVASIDTPGNLTQAGAVTQTGVQPIAMAATPDGKFVYVLNASGATVSQFAVATDGSLTQPAVAIGTGLQPAAIAVDPQARFVAVANTNSGAGGTLSIYTINTTTGALSPLAAPVSLNIDDPRAVTISGNFVYVAGADSIDVLIFTPQAFTFTFENGSPFAAGPAGTNITALYSPPQQSTVLFAADASTNTLLSFSIDNSGALTSTGSLPTGTQPVALVADNQNRFLFVANKGSNDISVFAVNATTGALTAASTTTLVSGAAPDALAYDPVNNFLLIGQSGTKQIVALAVNTSTGGLSTLGAALTVTNAASAMAVAKP